MSDFLWVGTRKGLFGVERASGPRRWRIASAAFLGDAVSLVHALPGGERVVAALEHGHFGAKVHLSDDGGGTWREGGTPTYPEKPADLEDIDAHKQVPFPWSLKKIWALADDEAGRLWCGTIPGGLFGSDDGGASWELVRPLWDERVQNHWFGGGADWPGIHSILVDPRDKQHITVGVSCGGVWETRDGGVSWKQGAQGMRAEYMPPEQMHEPGVQDPHRIVQCTAEPDVLWCQHHNGVFRTTRGCGHWEEIEISPSSFGFGVAVHPTDPSTAFFVPGVKDEKRYPVDGSLVVTRTRDGGRSFDVLREGLPQEHAYDLVYRHALELDDTGERLAFGSTTGNLWVSEDQGDTFQCVATSLPPVYSVHWVR